MNGYTAGRPNGSKMARYDSSTNNKEQTQEPQPSTSISNDDVWGDDDDDDFLWNATQLAERVEGICGTRNPSPPFKRGLPRINSLTSCDMTPVEILSLRRQRLESNSQNHDDFSRVLGGKDSAGEQAMEKIKALEQQMSTLQHENYRLKGETSIIRKQCDYMKREQQEESKKRILMEAENKKKVNEITVQYTKEVQTLKSKIQDNSQMLLNMSFPAHKTAVVITGNSSANNPTAFLEPASQQCSFINERIPDSPPNTMEPREEGIKPLMFTKEVQTILDEPSEPLEGNYIAGKSIQKQVRVGLEDEDLVGRLTPEEIREDFYRQIERMVELRYQMILPTLDQVVIEAPKEIMKRLVRGCETKSAFPDVVDCMFQWGIDKERKKIRANTGIAEPTLPTLPAQYEPGVNFHEIQIGIEVRFQNAGVWGALMEIRDWLQQVLKSLEGEGRFRMYEHNTLKNFWKLLFWANELWRCILFEEENQELVETHKKSWVKELQGWTGLVLKCDWRDYFVIELEVEVRKLTLNILESIVTAGYFEQTKNRYEILYRVIKDALTKDAFRSSRNVQHILKIVTWSVSDVKIMKHLCYKNNEANCLARLIGENVLKVSGEETDPTTVAVLYLDYLYLLEALMVKNPIRHHHSKLARPKNTDIIIEPSKIEIPIPNQMEHVENDSAMDYDFVGTQLACPVKFSLTGTETPLNVELTDEDLSCWLDPSKYEDPYCRRKLCQCRKVLMGTAVFVLHSIFQFWSQGCLDHEKEMEALQSKEQVELKSLKLKESFPKRESGILSPEEQITTDSEKKRLEFLQDKDKFLSDFIPDVDKILRKESEDSEWHLDDMLRKGREIKNGSLPQWFSDYKRQSNVLELAISKGIFVINFIMSKSENLAAAIGTEAYKEYMILVPLFRLYMEKLDLNRVDHDFLTSITPECEEDHISDYSDTNGENMSTETDDHDAPLEIDYHMDLKELSASTSNEIGGKTSETLKKLQTTISSVSDVESTGKELRALNEDRFFSKSGVLL